MSIELNLNIKEQRGSEFQKQELFKLFGQQEQFSKSKTPQRKTTNFLRKF